MSKRPLFAPSFEDVNRMLEVAENPRDRLLIRILAYCGLRESELVGNEELEIPALYLPDIIWEKKQIMIRGKGWERKAPQPIDSETLQIIKKYIQANNLPREAKLFDLSTRQVRRIVKDIALKAGVSNAEYMSPHRLRAFFITHIIEEFDIETARRLARHRQIATTQRYSFLAMKKIQERYETAFEKTMTTAT